MRIAECVSEAFDTVGDDLRMLDVIGGRVDYAGYND
jgi:hypothetical protein